jgi:hypothetical protein
MPGDRLPMPPKAIGLRWSPAVGYRNLRSKESRAFPTGARPRPRPALLGGKNPKCVQWTSAFGAFRKSVGIPVWLLTHYGSRRSEFAVPQLGHFRPARIESGISFLHHEIGSGCPKQKSDSWSARSSRSCRLWCSDQHTPSHSMACL